MTRLKRQLASRKGTMQHKITIFFLISLLFGGTLSLWAATIPEDVLPYKKNLKEKILSGTIFSESSVKSQIRYQKKWQELHFTIAGLNPKSCEFALKKLSLYENYNQFLDFVKKSEYDNTKEEINFLLSHTLLPYDMQLIFNLPRITKTGVYPFVFEIGILKNLKGTIHVVNYKNRCLFFTKADWDGPHTGFPDLIFEFFTVTLAKHSMEKLFRLSQTLSH